MQELRSCTLVPNFSLRSLVSGWAERQRISDLPSFSKEVGRQRSQASGGAAAAALAGLRLAGSSEGGEAAGGSSTVRYPTVQPPHDRPDPPPSALGLDQQQLQDAAPSAGPARPAAAQPPRRKQVSPQQGVELAGSAAAQPGLYPSDQQPPMPDKRVQADTALGALRTAATQRGGARGAAAYSAWTLQQLAGDAEGRELLWEVRRAGAAWPTAAYRTAARCFCGSLAGWVWSLRCLPACPCLSLPG